MNRLLRVFDHAGDAFWAVDGHHRIVAWNSAAEQCLGYPPAEAVGCHCYDLLAGRDPDGTSICMPGCAVMETARCGLPVRCFDLLARGRDDDLRRLNVSVVGAPDPRTGRLDLLLHLGRLVQPGQVWPASLRIHLLGPMSVERLDGSVVEGALWRRLKVRALLALLALQRGCPVHRDLVVEALWPDLGYVPALHNLNTTVYNLRRSLEPDLLRGADSRFVRYDGDCLFLNGGSAHWLDVSAFETAVARARRAQAPPQARALYREALARHGGDFLPDLVVGLGLSWCSRERDRLHELHLAALEELGVLCERDKRPQEAIDLYLAILAAEPCRESACRRLVQVLLQRGDRSDALVHYRRLAKCLDEEFGIKPAPETRHLVEAAVQAS